MCTPTASVADGGKRANGPMLQPTPMSAPSITQCGNTSVSAPISLLRITQPAWARGAHRPLRRGEERAAGRGLNRDRKRGEQGGGGAVRAVANLTDNMGAG